MKNKMNWIVLKQKARYSDPVNEFLVPTSYLDLSEWMDWCGVWDGEKRRGGRGNEKEKDVGDVGRMAKPGYGKRRMPRLRWMPDVRHLDLVPVWEKQESWIVRSQAWPGEHVSNLLAGLGTTCPHLKVERRKKGGWWKGIFGCVGRKGAKKDF